MVESRERPSSESSQPESDTWVTRERACQFPTHINTAHLTPCGTQFLGALSMPAATRTFPVFGRSTFEDLKADRDTLQRDVFPRLRKLCEENNARGLTRL